MTGKPATQTPQVWALYKEVQDYHDQGMKVPDDVLLLFSDDNWGNVRRLPERGGRDRKGGYSVYYHFDYVGGPRNYKWLNTNQIEKTWQLMNLTHEQGADQLWIVNVGDIKPMEFPISFFLDMAWSPEQMSLAALNSYAARWAAASFGPALAQDIGAIVTRYSQYAARRKPELVDSGSFPLGEASANALDGGEFGLKVAEWAVLERQVAAVKKTLRADQLDTCFQLVEHPVIALANFYQRYYAVAWNRKLAAANDARANGFADLAEAAFKRDQTTTDRHHAVNSGKWAGMMKQTHIGYTGWQEPKAQIMPTVTQVAVAEGQPVPPRPHGDGPSGADAGCGHHRSAELQPVICRPGPCVGRAAEPAPHARCHHRTAARPRPQHGGGRHSGRLRHRDDDPWRRDLAGHHGADPGHSEGRWHQAGRDRGRPPAPDAEARPRAHWRRPHHPAGTRLGRRRPRQRR